MPLKFFIFFVLIVGVAEANNRYVDQMIESENNGDKRDQDAYESFASPVYSPAVVPKSGGLPPGPKSGYNAPPPPPVSTGYPAYLNGVGYGNIYGYGTSPYGRYGQLPFSSAFYNLGSPYGALPYGFGPGVPAGLGYGASFPYGAGYAYGNPLPKRASYSPYTNAYIGYGGLGYRYGGYNSPIIRAPGVSAPAAYASVPPQYPGPYTGVPAAVPAAYASVPAPAVPAAFARVPAPAVPAAYARVPAPAVPGPLPALPPYRPPVVTTQAKDGSLRYAYAPPQKAAA